MPGRTHLDVWRRRVTFVIAAHISATGLRADLDPTPERGLRIDALVHLLHQLLDLWGEVCIVCHQPALHTQPTSATTVHRNQHLM